MTVRPNEPRRNSLNCEREPNAGGQFQVTALSAPTLKARADKTNGFSRVLAVDMGEQILCALLAVLLLGAALAKAVDFTNTASGMSGARSVVPHLLMVQCEGGLAIWLLSRRRPRTCRSAALCFFIAAACFAAFKGIDGASACGCFGSAAVSPWWALAIDGVAIVALAYLSRQPCLATSCRPATIRSMFIGGIGMVLLAYCGAVVLFGNPDDAINWLCGDRVSTFPRLVNLGQCDRGEHKTIDLRVSNREPAPITIVGVKAACDRRVKSTLPVVVPPNQSRQLTLTFALIGAGPEFREIITLYRGDGVVRELRGCLVVGSLVDGAAK